jgi:hypothetical protein
MVNNEKRPLQNGKNPIPSHDSDIAEPSHNSRCVQKTAALPVHPVRDDDPRGCDDPARLEELLTYQLLAANDNRGALNEQSFDHQPNTSMNL